MAGKFCMPASIKAAVHAIPFTVVNFGPMWHGSHPSVFLTGEHRMRVHPSHVVSHNYSGCDARRRDARLRSRLVLLFLLVLVPVGHRDQILWSLAIESAWEGVGLLPRSNILGSSRPRFISPVVILLRNTAPVGWFRRRRLEESHWDRDIIRKATAEMVLICVSCTNKDSFGSEKTSINYRSPDSSDLVFLHQFVRIGFS